MSHEKPTSGSEQPIRPRDLAVLLLASGDLRPRQRARDQQADVTGLLLKTKLLTHLAALDPEPAELEAALVRLIDEMGPPTGPTRAIATTFRDEWQAASVSPEWIAQLLAEATNQHEEDRHHGQSLRR